MGPDRLALAGGVPAQDAADCCFQRASGRALLGDAGQALFARAFALTRHFETKGAVLRSELAGAPSRIPSATGGVRLALVRYREREAAPDLRGLVECFWSLELPAAAARAEPQAIFPDGRVELVLHFGARFERLRSDGRLELQPRHLLVGQMTQATRLRPSGAAQALGVRFRPGAAGAVLRAPLKELRDRIVPLGAAGLRAPLPESALEDAPHERARVGLLQTWLRRCLALGTPAPAGLAAGVAALACSNGLLPLDSVMAATGLGARQLERAFERHVGLPPKLFARILRFQSVFAAAGGARPALPGLALDCGYADQAHLTRDFREFADTTPGAYFGGERGLSALFTRERARG